MKLQSQKGLSRADRDLNAAIRRIYELFGPDLGAFFRWVTENHADPRYLPAPIQRRQVTRNA